MFTSRNAYAVARRRTSAALVAIVAAAVLVSPTSALADTPTNDSFASGTVISSFPFSDSLNNTFATREPGEPGGGCFNQQTVWYTFIPTVDGVVSIDTQGSVYDASVNLYRSVGPGFDGLSWIGCTQFGGSLTINAQAGVTYFIQAGDVYGGGGPLHVNVRTIAPPSNDNFAAAKPVGSVPFSETVDATAATTEAAEPPTACGYSATASVWYAVTPTTAGSVSASVYSPSASTQVAVYSGASLNTLTSLGCRSFGSTLTVHVDSGTTYYFQVSTIYGAPGPLTFNLVPTPPPTAYFSYNPGDPSTFDGVQFYDGSYDPGGLGIQSQAWKFGDGTTATGCCPSHRFSTDGDYKVEETVATADGRTASTSQVVHVKTHDVAITKVTVPSSAGAGQTRHITIGLSNRRYPETVQVQLFKSVPGYYGFQQVGVLNGLVPVQKAGSTTPFDFSYTFTSDDAAVGKVTFQAVVAINGARDAQAADNTAIALPTKVS